MRKKSPTNILFFRYLFLPILLLFSVVAQAQTEIDVVGTCLPANPPPGSTASTKFFARYAQTPDSVLWKFGTVNPNTGDSLTSENLQPIVSFPEAAGYNVKLFVWNNGAVDSVEQFVQITTSDVQIQIIDEDTGEQIPNEVVLCGPDKVLKAQDSEGNELEVTWFKPQSSDPPNPVPTTPSITIGTEKVPDLDKYKDVGTYYIIYTDPASGCEIYQTFQVVVYEEQDQNNSRWFFGNGAGIDFLDNNKPLITTEMAGADEAPQGNALVGDLNEDVLFLTNGEKVWYGNAPLPAANGDNVGGSQDVTQNSLFVKFPADQTLFYLFTINGQGSLFYNLLDLKITDPRPGVALSELGANQDQPLNAIPLAGNVTEKLTSADRDSSGAWVVTHDLGDTFLSFPVGPEGIGQPVRSSIGSVHTNSTGYMRISAEGILAATVNEGSSSHIELFRFDTDSGAVTDLVRLDNLPASGTLYGLEFAGNRLYATVKNPSGPSYLYQYTIDSALDKTFIESSRVALKPVNEELGALQLDPNGELKIAVNGRQQLFVIPSPTDSLNSSRNLADNPYVLAAGTNSTLGLPNFGQPTGSSDRQGSVFAENVCEGDTLRMFATPRYPSNDVTFFFTVFDNQNQEVYRTQEPVSDSAQAVVPPDVYAAWGFGQFTVRLQILNECSPNPPEPDYPGPNDEPVEAVFYIGRNPVAVIGEAENLLLCEDQFITLEGFAEEEDGSLSADTIKYRFTWYDQLASPPVPVQESDSVSTSGNKLTVSTAGRWFLVVEDRLTGCTGESAGKEVLDNRPQAELGEDRNVCMGETLSGSLDASFQNASDFSFAWFLNGQSLNNSGQTQPLDVVDTEFPGSYQFVVEITPATAEAGECFKRDTVNVLVSAEPLVNIIASENNCDGTAVLTAEIEGGSGDFSYQWSGPGITSGQGTRQIRISGTGAQDYTVSVSDGSTGCSTTTAPYTIDLENPLADLRLEADRECGEALYRVNLETSYSGDSTALSIRWFLGGQEVTEYQNLRSILAEEGPIRADVILETANCADTASQEIDLAPIGDERLSLQSTYVLCPSTPEMSTDTLRVEGFQLYRWRNLTTGQEVVNRTGQFILRTEGNYELQVNDCDPVSFRVIYDCTPTLWLPNAIRIGGTNNVFRILNQNMLAGVSDFQILIMNRWGQPIWQSNDPAFEWRGTTQNGEPVMVNTYVYVITYRNKYSEDQRIQKQRGGVTVLK